MRLAYAQVLLAGAAAVGTWMIEVMARLPSRPGPIVAVGLVFFSIYALDRVAAEPETDALNHPERERFVRRHARKLLLLAVAAYAVALGLAAREGWGHVLILLLPLAAVLLYSFPFVPRPLARRLGFSRLKDILVVKNMVVAATFATTLALAPVPTRGAVAVPTLLALWVFLFVRFFINSIVFDLRDEHGDRQKGTRTLPVVIGADRTRRLLHTLNLALGVFALAVPLLGLGPPAFAALAVGTPFATWYLRRTAGSGSLHFLCDVVADGELYVTGLAFLLVRCMVP
jgi:4-hydroxybenzoate polyprenyltransferase